MPVIVLYVATKCLYPSKVYLKMERWSVEHKSINYCFVNF